MRKLVFLVFGLRLAILAQEDSELEDGEVANPEEDTHHRAARNQDGEMHSEENASACSGAGNGGGRAGGALQHPQALSVLPGPPASQSHPR